MGKRLMEILKRYQEIISYLFWGDDDSRELGSYALFNGICHLGVMFSNCLSWICAIVFAYFTNKLWVFKSKSWKGKVLWREAGLFYLPELLQDYLKLFLSHSSLFLGWIRR